MKKYLIVLYLMLFAGQMYAENEANPTKQLSEKFSNTLQEAIAHEKEQALNCPFIIQDLLSMTLYTSSHLTQRFSLKKDLYKTVGEFSHIPLVIHNIAFKYDWKFNDQLSAELLEYQRLLQEVAISFEQSDIDDVLKLRVKEIIQKTNKYIEEVTLKRTIDTKGYFQYSRGLDTLIKKNLEDGAKTQIDQFHLQIQSWKQQYPQENWNCLRVAILGTHGPRDGYVLKQYFQWLLKEPSYEKNVVYVEFPDVSDILSDKNKSNTQAINALVNGAYQLELGENFMHQPDYMQHDVMSEAATNILKKMGE